MTRVGSSEIRRFKPDPAITPGRGAGGGAYDWMPDGSKIIYASKEGSLVVLDVDSGRTQTQWSGIGTDLAGISISPDSARVAVISKQQDVLIVERGTHQIADSSQDFAFDPTWWGDNLVWQAWNIPNMPWEVSGLRIWNGRRAKWLVKPKHHQIQQPRANGELGCVSDQDGWLNIARLSRSFLGKWTLRPLLREPFEHANPSWGMGQRSWARNGDAVFFNRNENGFGRLVQFDLRTGIETQLGKGVHRSIDAGNGFVVALRSGARTPTQIVVYDTNTSERITVDSVADFGQYRDQLVEPQTAVVSNDGVDIPVRIFNATTPNGRMIVWIHGGPTDQWQVTWYPRFVYWLSRGYSIVVPDHRGTTGHGRAFQMALNGKWGDSDSADVAAVIKWLYGMGLATPQATALAGGSAGGFTALNVIADHPGIVACAVVTYPVTDLAHLAATSHRFEKHSVASLVGDIHDQSLYQKRSPLFRARQLATTPLLIMHGDMDTVVPVQQSRTLVDAVQQAGGEVRLQIMEGENHGFRSPANQMLEYSLAEEFLSDHLGTVET